MINPYYYLFYLIYSFLNKNVKYKENIVFGTYSIMFILLFLHLFYLMITLISLFPDYHYKLSIPKPVFGISLVALFFILNYLLFDRKERYKLVIDRLIKTKIYKKILTGILIILYLFMPIILKIIF